MSFTKKFIKRDNILNNINDISKIKKMVNADSLILDKWSNNFFENFDFNWKKYNQNREILNKNDLYKLSNVYLNLKTNPILLDIELTSSILEVSINGDLNEMIIESINLIEEYYSIIHTKHLKVYEK